MLASTWLAGNESCVILPGYNETAEASFPKVLGSLQANRPRSKRESALESGRASPPGPQLLKFWSPDATAPKKFSPETIRLTASHSPRVAQPFANRKQRVSVTVCDQCLIAGEADMRL